MAYSICGHIIFFRKFVKCFDLLTNGAYCKHSSVNNFHGKSDKLHIMFSKADIATQGIYAPSDLQTPLLISEFFPIGQWPGVYLILLIINKTPLCNGN